MQKNQIFDTNSDPDWSGTASIRFSRKFYPNIYKKKTKFGKFTLGYLSLCAVTYTNQRGIVNSVIQSNSYFFNSENVLLTMIFDERKSVRKKQSKGSDAFAIT